MAKKLTNIALVLLLIISLGYVLRPKVVTSDLAQVWYDGTANENGILITNAGGWMYAYSTENASNQPLWFFPYTTGENEESLHPAEVKGFTAVIASASLSAMLITDVDKYVADIGWHPPLVWPIYEVRKTWVSKSYRQPPPYRNNYQVYPLNLQSDVWTWYDGVAPDSTWNEWFDTSRGWF